MPDIPPEVIEALKNSPLNLDVAYIEAKRNRSTVISWLQAEAERQRLTPEQKRGYFIGALSLMGLYDFQKKYDEEIRPLELLWEQAAYTDERHTEPPLPA